MSLTQYELEVARKLDAFCDLWRRAQAGDMAAVYELDIYRCNTIRHWRQRAIDAEAQLRDRSRRARVGGLN